MRLRTHRRRRAGAARSDVPGAVLRCLLLSQGPEWVVVDVATGALVRSRASGWPAAKAGADDDNGASRSTTGGARPERARALEVVDIELGSDDEPPDPARPEAVMVKGAPLRVGVPRRRAARRILKVLLPVDPRRPLLGSLGPSIAYEELDGSRPSVALVSPDRPPIFVSDRTGVACQFTLGGRKHRLPVLDTRFVESDPGARATALGTDAVSRAIGGPPRYLVIGLGAPRRGQAPKLVLSVLPRP